MLNCNREETEATLEEHGTQPDCIYLNINPGGVVSLFIRLFKSIFLILKQSFFSRTYLFPIKVPALGYHVYLSTMSDVLDFGPAVSGLSPSFCYKIYFSSYYNIKRLNMMQKRACFQKRLI